MRRRYVHLAFGLTAFGLACLASYNVWRLQQARHVNEAIASASVLGADASLPEARFARAAALSRAGEYDAALGAYKAIIQGNRADLRRAALYNLGNLHLRAALRNGRDNVMESLPLIELAKQSYRDLLRENPADWDARYNLERALWLAPEYSEEVVEDDVPTMPKERTISTLRGARMDLP